MEEFPPKKIKIDPVKQAEAERLIQQHVDQINAKGRDMSNQVKKRLSMEGKMMGGGSIDEI